MEVFLKFSWHVGIGCPVILIKKKKFIAQGEEKPKSAREKCPLSTYANSPLFLAVTEDMTSHIVQGPRFMRSRFASGR